MSRKRRKQTKFVADAMLGSTARKLRAFGFDTAYFREGDDSALVALAEKEGRAVLTADRSLAARALKVPVLLLDARTEGRRLESIREWAQGSGNGLVGGPPRCSVCNGELDALTRKEAEGKVPESVAAKHRVFHVCRSCDKLYWRGVHWKKLRWLRRRLGPVSHERVSGGRQHRGIDRPRNARGARQR